MKARDLVNKVVDIARNYKTLYVYACFGSPLYDSNKQRYTNNCDYNRQSARSSKIWNASSDTFGFDCVNLIKGILWGWNGNKNATYGGAAYATNGCPDTNANGMFHDYCYDKSNDFRNIIPGEFVWMEGHIGVYIGDGLAVECTPIWADGVQITAVGNIGSKSGYATRTWTSHGKSKLIDYSGNPIPENVPVSKLKFSVGQDVVINGQLYGTSDGDNPGGKVENVQTKITRAVSGKPFPYNTTNDLGWISEESIKLLEGDSQKELSIDDFVDIIGNGNGSSCGDSNIAVPGYSGRITGIYKGRAFPYQVSDDEGVLGYYPAESLKRK